MRIARAHVPNCPVYSVRAIRSRRLTGRDVVGEAVRPCIVVQVNQGDASREARLRALVRKKRENQSARELEEDAARVRRDASSTPTSKGGGGGDVGQDGEPIIDPHEFEDLVNPLQVIAGLSEIQKEIADAVQRGDEDAAYYLELKLGRLAKKLK